MQFSFDPESASKWYMVPAKIFVVIAFFSIIALDVSAQESRYPNELEGFKFFGAGKLKDLELGKSTKDDIVKIFGKGCEAKSDYDAEWTISFEYFDDIWIKESSNNAGAKLTYYLDSKYLGKVRSIRLYPKKHISFNNISFSDSFQRVITTSTSDARFGKSRMIVYDEFQDSDGLSYEIYNKTNYDDIKGETQKSDAKGDLFFVGYNLTKAFEKEMFILQKN